MNPFAKIFNVKDKSLIDTNPKIHKFLNRNNDQELIDLVQEYSHYANYDSGIWANNSDIQLSREIPQMLKDPIIQSCLAVLMETAFQPDEKHQIMWVNSDYPIIKQELDAFHERIHWQTMILTMAYNLLIWGNIPYRHVFNSEGQLDFVLPIADYTSVVPIIFANTCLGYLVNGEYAYPYEYSYAQLQYYKNLGGTSYSRISSYLQSTQNGSDIPFTNEFMLAPSYLTTAVQPWKNIRIMEDALLLNRMDQSNYYRLIKVGVGGDVDSKPAVRLLNYYRDLFKKVRRISYDSSGMASKGKSQEFEVILPENDRQKINIEDVGGTVDVKALEDMDKQLNKLFAALRVQPWMIGYSTDVPSGLDGSPAALMDSRLSKVARTLIFSVTRELAEIDALYLQSRGFNVTTDMWTYGTVSSTILEDKSRTEILKVATDNLKNVVSQFSAMNLEYNKEYLVEAILGPAFASTHVDLAKLFEKKESEDASELQSVTSNFKAAVIQRTLKTISASAMAGTPVAQEISAFLDSKVDKAPTFNLITQGKISFEEACKDEFPLSDSTEIDLSSISTESHKDSHALVDDWNSMIASPKTNVQSLAFLPITFPIVIPKDTKVTMGDLRSAVVKPIESVIKTPGGFLFQKKEDLVTYLGLKKSDLFTCIAQNMIVVDNPTE